MVNSAVMYLVLPDLMCISTVFIKSHEVMSLGLKDDKVVTSFYCLLREFYCYDWDLVLEVRSFGMFILLDVDNAVGLE
ncbi:hypothetical protein Tco_1527153 [Tanacetum coccineum]